MIAEARQKCKSLMTRAPRDVLVVAVLVLASSLSFGLGYLAGRDAGQGSSITIIPSPFMGDSAAPMPGRDANAETSGVVASKNGTKYYLPSCAGADRISSANKVWFASAQAAALAGYTPAANCKGL